MPAQTTLASYRLECRRLLHDATGKFWSNAELTDYINDAQKRVASDTGCLRRLVTAYISEGIEQQVIGGVTGANVTAGGTGYTSPTVAFTGGGGTGATGTVTVEDGIVTAIVMTDVGQDYTSVPTVVITGSNTTPAAATASIIPNDTMDIMNITPIWGNQRIPCNYMPWTEFNAKLRSWVVTPQRPVMWSRYGTSGGAAFLGPIPDQTYTTEFDTAVLPEDMVDDTDPSELRYPYTSPVAYWACSKAKINQQAYGEAESFLQMYRMKIMEAQASVQMRRIPNPYNGYSGA